MRSARVNVCSFLITLLLVFSCQKNHNSPGEFVETQPPLLEAHTIRVNDQIFGFYSGLPTHYHETSQTYPLLIWIHGNGQVGNGNTDLPRILFGGVPKLLDEQLFPAHFTVNGKNYSFIILAPQFTGWPAIDQVQSFLDYAKQHYRVDPSRVYLAGLSMGGIVATDFSAVHGSELAAVVPMSGISISGDIKMKCTEIANFLLPVWIFQNTSDQVFDVNNARSFVTCIDGCNPVIGVKYTEFLPFGENGHDSWTTATDPSYKEENMNIYEWMLQYKR